MSYIPATDSILATYAQNFVDVLNTSYAAYGFTAAEAALLAGYNTDFQAAYSTSINPDTRTTPNVTAKDASKAVLIAMLRQFAQRIQSNAGVTNEQKAAIGVTVRDGGHTPVPAPTTQPLLSLIGATPLQHTVRFADASTPSKRAKPVGSTGLLLFVVIGATPASSPDGAQFVHIATKNPFIVSFDSGDVGKYATYFAKWVTRTGLEGPWSSPVSMTVAG